MVTQGTGAGTPPNEIYKAALQTEYQRNGMTLWAGDTSFHLDPVNMHWMHDATEAQKAQFFMGVRLGLMLCYGSHTEKMVFADNEQYIYAKMITEHGVPRHMTAYLRQESDSEGDRAVYLNEAKLIWCPDYKTLWGVDLCRTK